MLGDLILSTHDNSHGFIAQYDVVNISPACAVVDITSPKLKTNAVANAIASSLDVPGSAKSSAQKCRLEDHRPKSSQAQRCTCYFGTV